MTTGEMESQVDDDGDHDDGEDEDVFVFSLGAPPSESTIETLGSLHCCCDS